MAIIKVKYSDMLKKYPNKVKEVIEKVNKSKSKLKNISPEKWPWALALVQAIDWDKVTDEKSWLEVKTYWSSNFNKIPDEITNHLEQEEKEFEEEYENDNRTIDELVEELSKGKGFFKI